MSRILPGQAVDPPFALDLADGGVWRLDAPGGDARWRLVVVYRGLHCPICKGQLQELTSKLDVFAAAGVAVAAASADDEARAKQTVEDWETGALPVAYGLNRAFAERFGLYVSNAIREGEPDLFLEPALLLFKDTMLYAAWIQTIPFSRPSIDAILSGVDYIEDNGYPPRGGA